MSSFGEWANREVRTMFKESSEAVRDEVPRRRALVWLARGSTAVFAAATLASRALPAWASAPPPESGGRTGMVMRNGKAVVGLQPDCPACSCVCDSCCSWFCNGTCGSYTLHLCQDDYGDQCGICCGPPDSCPFPC
jgi:hypothetical protein